MPRPEVVERRLVDVAVPFVEAGAARVEAAGARRVDRIRDVTLEHDPAAQAPARRVRDRHGREERARVRMLGRRVELLLVRDLGDLAEVHHEHAVGDVTDDVQVVRDEDVREPEVALQVLEQVQDLRLHGHVEGGDGLVADDQLRVDRQGARDADPLPLPAGELVREAVVVLRVQADDLQQLLDAALDLRLGADLVHLERLGDDEADPLALVQARVRILEDHHQLAADRAHVGPAQVGDVAAAEGDPAARRIEQAHQAARHRRLAAARLADDAERLTLLDGEADPVDGLDARDLLLEDDPARDGEVLDEVLDDEQVVRHQPTSASVLSSSFVASRSFVASSRWHACRCPGSFDTGSSAGCADLQTSIT